MSFNIPKDNSCCGFRPPTPFPHDFLETKTTRLDRLMDKIDANDDAKLSRKEMSEATDTDNDGFVSQAEKAEMRAQLKEYTQDGTNRLSTMGKASQLLEFLDDEPSPHPLEIPHGKIIIDDEKPILKPWEDNRSNDMKEFDKILKDNINKKHTGAEYKYKF